MASLLSALLLLGAAAAPARAAIAAWWNGVGPQIMLQNETTGQIRYSPCNSGGQPTYSYTDASVFSLAYKPMNGTPLAGTGWWTNVITVASIFYVDVEGRIANALFNCDMSSGRFRSQGSWIVSNGVPSIHPSTGLAAILLGAKTGYRIYFHDNDTAINELTYTVDTNWRHAGIISHDINSLPALAAAFNGTDNITVVSARDVDDIAETRYNKGRTWYRATLPHPLGGNLTISSTNRSNIAINKTAPAAFSLPAWDGKTNGLGVSIDNLTRYLWYIGNDSRLYSVADQNYTWSPQANQSTAVWPLADKPNADLAVAYDANSSTVRIYYMVKGLLSEVKFQDNSWKAWSALAAPPPQPTRSATPSNSAAAAAAGADTGLSTGAKAGVGVGVALGAIALGAILAVMVLAWRKRHRHHHHQPSSSSSEDRSTTVVAASTPALSYGSPAAGQYDSHVWEQHKEMDGAAPPTELYAPPPQPVYELPSQIDSSELPAEGGPPGKLAGKGQYY